MSTTGYQAAIDTGDIIMSYGLEATWGTLPSVAFQQIRMLSESLAGNKNRTRPAEISNIPQVAPALTTKIEAGGDIGFAWSAGTYDDFIAASLRGAWATAVNMSATTIAATADGFTDSGNGFVTGHVVAGQMIKIGGFTTTSINTYYRVLTVAAGAITTSPVPAATEIAGDTVTVKGSLLRNGSTFQSFYMQKKLASDKFLRYAGSWPSGGSFETGVGDFCKGTFNFVCKSEATATTGASTGAETAPPTGRIMDAITGISDLRRNGVAIAAVIQKIGINWKAENSRSQMGIGSANAQGIGTGQISVNGTLETYFADFTLYDEFIAETGGTLSFMAKDNAGLGYYFTICNATIMNPKVVAGGPNQDVMATFEIEGNPDSTNVYGGYTMQIDRFVS